MIDTGAQYNSEVCFSLFGEDKINMLSNFGVEKEVEVAFNISSREFNGKWYHNIDAWKITAIGEESPTPTTAAPEVDIDTNPTDDVLPF